MDDTLSCLGDNKGNKDYRLSGQVFFFLNIFCVRLVESPDMEPTKPNCVMNSEITNFRKNKGWELLPPLMFPTFIRSWFPCIFFSAKLCLSYKLGARPRQTVATATSAAPTWWTRLCCCSTASTMVSPGMSSLSTSQRTLCRLSGCLTTSLCKWPEGEHVITCPFLGILGFGVGVGWLSGQCREPRQWQSQESPDHQHCVAVFQRSRGKWPIKIDKREWLDS